MQFFHVRANFNKYRYFEPTDTSVRDLRRMLPDPGKSSELKELRYTSLRGQQTRKDSDFPGSPLNVQLLSPRAWTVLAPVLAELKTVPAFTPSGEYVGIVSPIVDILDEAKSQLERMDDEDYVLFIDRYAFKTPIGRMPAMFRIPQTSGTETFATIELIDLVQRNKLTGFVFTELPT